MPLRKLLVRVPAGLALIAALTTTTGHAGARPTAPPPPRSPVVRYAVLAADPAHPELTERAVRTAGGRVVAHGDAIGLLTVQAMAQGFVARLRSAPAVAGVARDRRIGSLPPTRRDREGVEQAPRSARPSSRPPHAPPSRPPAPRPPHPHPRPDTFEGRQWDMRMIRAPQAHALAIGTHAVLAAVIDTGIDASHPDLAPNVDTKLSRNFTVDMPDIDGPCAVPSCIDPPTIDDNGHGTHVAGTIAAAANGMGIVGVAPGARLVNLRAGQDSGFFFLLPTVHALVAAGDIGVDVANMSFYVDPWLFNCGHNRADVSDAQYEQRTIVEALNRALRYAHDRGVTLVSAIGNDHLDLGKPTLDLSSPDLPAGAAYARSIDPRDCLSLPAEGPHVLAVTSIGPSQTKADYSSYGVQRTWVAAPGGWVRDGVGTPTYLRPSNTILSTYPKKVLQKEGSVDAQGNVAPWAATFVLKDCTPAGACGYYTYLQGTSMAAPHVAGVAALAVAAHGFPDARRGGLTLPPDRTALLLASLADQHACPSPPLRTYAPEGRAHSFDALCEGSPRFNGFYGYGVVDALAIVTGHRSPPR
ncbi:MAG: peptidase s8 and s53 in kexin sedolisin [Acidimicrobiales bacterium]|nr:peptidase s8 and s53 in kexin sedolisin [Acidimicrobiales bacterium]